MASGQLDPAELAKLSYAQLSGLPQETLDLIGSAKIGPSSGIMLTPYVLG